MESSAEVKHAEGSVPNVLRVSRRLTTLTRDSDLKLDEEPAPGLEELLVPVGLRPDLQQTCEIVLLRGWDGIIWQRDFTGLHLAAKHGSEDAVRLLLHATAAPDLDKEDCRGMRPVDHARKRGFSYLLKLLDPAHATELTRRATPAEHQGRLTEAELEELRVVHARQCKEVEMQVRKQAQKQLQELEKALAAEQTARAKDRQDLEAVLHSKGKLHNIDKVEQLQVELAEAKANASEHQRRAQDLETRFAKVNQTVQNYLKEVIAERAKVQSLEQELARRDMELAAACAARDTAPAGPGATLDAATVRNGAAVHTLPGGAGAAPGPRSPTQFQQQEFHFSVDLTQSAMMPPDDGIRTRLNSEVDHPLEEQRSSMGSRPSPMHSGVRQLSADFWENVLRFSHDPSISRQMAFGGAISDKTFLDDCDEADARGEPIELRGTPIAAASKDKYSFDLTETLADIG